MKTSFIIGLLVIVMSSVWVFAEDPARVYTEEDLQNYHYHRRIASLIDTIGIEEKKEMNTIKTEENQGKNIIEKRTYQSLENVLK